MPFTLGNLFDFVRSRVSDDSDGNADLPSLLEYTNEGIRRNRRKFDIPTSEYSTQIDLFNGVYRYTPPAGLKDWTQITDQGKLPDNLNFERTTESDFWRAYLDHNRVAFSRNGMNKSLLVRIVSPLSNIQLDSCDNYDYDGTWTADAASDALGVATNKLDYLTGTGSVSFNVDVSQSVNDYARIYKTMGSKDLSTDVLKEVAVFFIDAYFPTAAVTSVTLQVGSDASNYYTSTITANWDATSFVVGWNQLGFDWSTATKVGNPDTQNITYLSFQINYANTLTDQTGFKIDSIWCRQRRRVLLHWTSDYLVIDGTTGLPKEAFTSISDTNSYFACDSAFTDWLGYHVLEEVFTYLVKDADARALNQAYLQETEKDLLESHPSNKPPVTYSYMESDDIQERLN